MHLPVVSPCVSSFKNKTKVAQLSGIHKKRMLKVVGAADESNLQQERQKARSENNSR